MEYRRLGRTELQVRFLSKQTGRGKAGCCCPNMSFVRITGKGGGNPEVTEGID
jgi:hypothetical protein